MDTIHTTNAVEFVDWRAKAKTKLEDENKAFKGSREARAVRDYILKTLICFADQEPRFAEVICNTKRTFSECCAAVVHNAGGMISDLDAYRRAAPGTLKGSPPGKATSFSFARNPIRTRHGIRWKWNPAEPSARNAATTTSSTQILRMPSLSWPSGSRSSSSA